MIFWTPDWSAVSNRLSEPDDDRGVRRGVGHAFPQIDLRRVVVHDLRLFLLENFFQGGPIADVHFIKPGFLFTCFAFAPAQSSTTATLCPALT